MHSIAVGTVRGSRAFGGFGVYVGLCVCALSFSSEIWSETMDNNTNCRPSPRIAGGFALNPGWGFRLMTMLTLTTGSAFIMWLGEQITERGVGNGMSLLIFAGIVGGPAARRCRPD